MAKLGDFASDAIKQYSVDKKAKKQEQWQQDLDDLFKRSADEFKAQQQPSMAELTGSAPTTTETYTPGGLQGSFAGNIPQSHVTTETTAAPQTFTGPELKTARPPRSSPFPTPSEILALGQPLNGIKVIDGLAALQKLNPQDDDKTRVERMRAAYVGLDQFSEAQKAAALPGLMGAFEQVYGINLGEKTYTPERWAAFGKALQVSGSKPPEDFTLSEGQSRFKGTGGEPIATVAKTAPPKADYTLGNQRFAGETNEPIATGQAPAMTPYQQEQIDLAKKNFGLSQQRLALAIKQGNKPAIDKESNGLADAVMAEPELWGQLTAGEKGKIAGELQRRGFKDFKKDPSATLDNRLSSAQAVLQTGNDMIKDLRDPKIAAMLGPAMGRYNSVADFVGNPPPEFARLAGLIESYSLANMGVHGMRATSGSEAIKQTLGVGRHTPASIIATIEGLNGFATHLIQNEAPKRLPNDTPPPTQKANPFR